jgi:GAF domain-containing protein
MPESTLSIQELLSMLETAGALSTETDPQKLVTAILAKACSMTASQDGAVLLYDSERRGLFFATAVGSKSGELMEKWGEQSSQRVPLENSQAGQAFTSRTMLVRDSEAGEHKHFKGVDEQTHKRSRSLVSMPLTAGGKTIGVLQVLNKTVEEGQPASYNPRDCELLGHLATLAATAIYKARLLHKLTAQMGLYSNDVSEDLLVRFDSPATREHLTVLFADLRGLHNFARPKPTPRRQGRS